MKKDNASAAPNAVAEKRIGIIGTGISGMTSAYLLSEDHEIVVYEANKYVGGHTNTVDVAHKSGVTSVDTGFIVYNEKNYPNLTALFAELEIATHPTVMSFGVTIDKGSKDNETAPQQRRRWQLNKQSKAVGYPGWSGPGGYPGWSGPGGYPGWTDPKVCYWIDDETIMIGTANGVWGQVSLSTDSFLAETRAHLRRSLTDTECTTYGKYPCTRLHEI